MRWPRFRGVDCLWIGHFDLSCSLGIPGQFDHRDFGDAVKAVTRACRKHGKALGRLVPTVDEAVALHQAGFDFLCYSGDVWALQGAVKAGLDEIRARTAGKAKKTRRSAPRARRNDKTEAVMSKFRVALSGDFKKPDGSAAFPDFDLGPLEQNPAVEYAYIQTNGVITASDLEGYDALILLIPRIEPESFPRDGRLAVIARFGVGYDTVNVQACTDHDCALVITPDGVRRPVAVSIITFMLALTGKLMPKDRITRQGPEGWARRNEHMGVGLVDRTLGQLGIGNIGAEVFRLAKPFGMKFIAHDPYADPKVAQELGVRLVGLEELFRQADVLSVSCPLNDETHHIVNAERLALMKPGAYLINTSRGPVVDEQALTEVLQERRIGGAGLDVFEQEPSPKGNPLYKLDNVLLTPHALCWTDQCFAGIGAADVKAVFDVMHGRVPTGIVNREIVERPAWRDKLKRYQAAFGG